MAVLVSGEIPQADLLSGVFETVEAIANGAKTYQQIKSAINRSGRQARYYRKASEILGLADREGRNNSFLTELGEEFLAATPEQKNEIVLGKILETPVFANIIAFFESKEEGVSVDDISELLRRLTDVDEVNATHQRRKTSVISWLKHFDIIMEEDNLLYINSTKIPEIQEITFTDVQNPILLRGFELQEYNETKARVSNAGEDIAYQVDSVKREKANQAHEALVRQAANEILDAQRVPRKNNLVDLAVIVDDEAFIFEMKSLNDENARSQIRKGISQLYEYRYLFDREDTNLVLVVEKELHEKHSWLKNYLENDRGIHLVWKNGDEFDASQETRDKVWVLF